MAYFYSDPTKEEKYSVVREAKGNPKDVLTRLLKEEVIDAGLSREEAQEKVEEFNNITDKELFDYTVKRKNEVKEEMWEKYLGDILGSQKLNQESPSQQEGQATQQDGSQQQKQVNPEEVQKNLQNVMQNKKDNVDEVV